jgi:ketosteroid isomerase-like protein
MSTPHVHAFVDQLFPAFEQGDDQAAAKQAEADNVRRVQAQYRAIAAREYRTTFAESLHPDVEFEILGPPDVPFLGKWRGKEKVVEVVERNFGMLEEQRPQVQTLVAQGDTVVVVGREQGKVRGSGEQYDFHWVAFFTFRDGLVVRVQEMVTAPGAG